MVEATSITSAQVRATADRGPARSTLSLVSLCCGLAFVWLARHGVAARYTSPAIFLCAAAGIYVSLVAMFFSRFRSLSAWLGLIFNLVIAEFWVILRFMHVM